MYKIGPVSFEILNIRRNQFLTRLVPFYVSLGKPEVTYKIKYGETLPDVELDNIIYENNVLAVAAYDDRVVYVHMAEHIPYAIVERHDFSDYTIFLQNDIFNYDLHPYIFPDLLHLEQILIHKNMLVLHSAFIEFEKKAILFTAPSGGGKSTQATLWRQVKGAQIINGDKSIIGREDGEWYAYGIPFSGASDFCKNETYPLKAIVVLGKGKDNVLYRNKTQIFPSVLSQITLNVWDKDFCERAMDLVAEICNEIPVYYYVCNREPEAVEVLYQELNKIR